MNSENETKHSSTEDSKDAKKSGWASFKKSKSDSDSTVAISKKAEAKAKASELQKRFFDRVKSGSKGTWVKTKTDHKESGFWGRLALGSAVVATLCMLYLAYAVPRNGSLLKDTGELRFLAQQMLLEVELVGLNQETENLELSFQKLADSQNSFSRLIGSAKGFSLGSSPLDAVRDSWQQVSEQLTELGNKKDFIKAHDEATAELQDAFEDLSVPYGEMSRVYDVMGAGTDQQLVIKDQQLLAQRLIDLSTELGSGMGLETQLGNFESGINEFSQVIDAQLQGSAERRIDAVTMSNPRGQLEIVAEIFNDRVKPAADRLIELEPQMIAFQENARASMLGARKISSDLSRLSNSRIGQAGVYLPSVLLLLALLTGLFAFYRILQIRTLGDQLRAEEQMVRQRSQAELEAQRANKIQQESERNQNAILRLLDELGDLADGDLTINATVSEDFTGAIADSVNFAIDQLRSLVSAINNTAISVARSSSDTQGLAMKLAEASEHQAQEIAGASAAINEMAVSIDQVSANAMESATVAERSVAIAYNGAEVVQRTINGMNTIREQIQETSKRIKRLGESSQEIGDIVSLINDIADQTNILALNAAIQASAAGEAGRGFAVVADEVQRLAERSAAATRQIETLVKTIQADTNEAVSSMEATTSEVVKGAKLAKDAGEALEEVQTVSNTLADLIQNISNAARQQAASAGHISNTMNIIQEITSQTTSGTIATARSVGQLNEMSLSLRESVSGFKLPETHQPETQSV